MWLNFSTFLKISIKKSLKSIFLSFLKKTWLHTGYNGLLVIKYWEEFWQSRQMFWQKNYPRKKWLSIRIWCSLVSLKTIFSSPKSYYDWVRVRVRVRHYWYFGVFWERRKQKGCFWDQTEKVWFTKVKKSKTQGFLLKILYCSHQCHWVRLSVVLSINVFLLSICLILLCALHF